MNWFITFSENAMKRLGLVRGEGFAQSLCREFTGESRWEFALWRHWERHSPRLYKSNQRIVTKHQAPPVDQQQKTRKIHYNFQKQIVSQNSSVLVGASPSAFNRTYIFWSKWIPVVATCVQYRMKPQRFIQIHRQKTCRTRRKLIVWNRSMTNPHRALEKIWAETLVNAAHQQIKQSWKSICHF